jgi:hypothetical protein
MRGRRRRRIIFILLLLAAIAYIGTLSVSAAERSSSHAGTTQPKISVPRKETSLPPVTTHSHPRPAVRHLLKDATISPLGMSSQAVNRLLDWAQAAGVKVISSGVNWATIQPYGPGSFSWGNLDAFVADVRHRGMQLRFQLDGFPDWARDPGQPSEAYAQWLPPAAPDELARWQAYVGDLARRFGGEVAYYEIWNEPNISPFFYPIPDPAEYADLLEASYTAIKALDPSAKVIFAGMSGNDLGFLNRVYQALDVQFGSLAKRDHHFFDILGVHPYSGSRPPGLVTSAEVYPDDFGTMDANFLGFEQLHDLMASYGEGYKPLYITEYGFTTLGFYGFPPISDATRATYLTQAFALVDKIPYVLGFNWYCLADANNGPGWEMLLGYYPSWQPSATYDAFKAAP